jgi:hypothetical protein
MARKRNKFNVGQVVRDNQTNGRYAQVIGYAGTYLLLRADTMEYQVPEVNVRRLTKSEAAQPPKRKEKR